MSSRLMSLVAMVAVVFALASSGLAAECNPEVVRGFYDAVTAGDYHKAYSYFSSKGTFPPEEEWVKQIEAFDREVERLGGGFTESVRELKILASAEDGCHMLIGVTIERRFERFLEMVFMGVDAELAPDGIVALVRRGISGYTQPINRGEKI